MASTVIKSTQLPLDMRYKGTASLLPFKMRLRTTPSSTFTAALLLSSKVHGQATSSGIGGIVPAETAITSPSATLLSPETLQLTEAVLDRVASDDLTSEYIDIFAFESNNTIAKRQASSCKTYPGDRLWPSTLIWIVFDLLLGRRLLKTEPIAAPCYDSEWGSQDLAECNALVSRFTKATTQCVVMLPIG